MTVRLRVFNEYIGLILLMWLNFEQDKKICKSMLIYLKERGRLKTI